VFSVAPKKATNQKQEADLFSGLSPPMEKTQHDYYLRKCK